MVVFALRRPLLVALALGLAGHLAVAQDDSSAGATSEPAVKFPGTWLNTAAPSPDAFRGKAVFLYFFEETCPKCRAKWPGLLETAAKHTLDPIVFVAVNSGTPAADVERYAHEVGLDWPIIVDLDRKFEQACDVGEISLQNIYKVEYVTAEGALKPGRFDDLEGTIGQALKGASWKVAPADVPDELRVAWRNVEFANYAQAAPTLTKAISSRKSELKAAAHKLSDAVTKQAALDLEGANLDAAKSKYRAYERYAHIAERYAGFPEAKQAAAARRGLAKDPDLRTELLAIKAVEKQAPLIHSPKPAARDRAIAAVRKIIDEKPDSEAARIGRELLGQP